MVLVGLSIRLWLDNWRSGLCCGLRLNAWAAEQGAWQNEHQWLHTRLDLCAQYVDTAVITAALLMLHLTCTDAICWLLDKAAFIGLLRWAAVLVVWCWLGCA